MSFSTYLSVLVSLAFVLGLMGVAVALLRRAQRGIMDGGSLPMSMLQRMPLGPKHALAAVQIGDRVVVMAVSENGVTVVNELEADECADILAANDAWQASRREKADARRDTLRVLTRRALPFAFALLAMTPVGARAQAGDSTVTPAPAPAVAAPAPVKPPVLKKAPVTPQFDLRMGGANRRDALRLSGPVGTVVMMGILTLLPTLVLMMTSFTRILIVLNFLKQAIGTQTAPPAQLIAAFAILLTGFVMAPTLDRVNRSALQPWLDGKINQAQMLDKGAVPFREFMLRQTRDRDIEVFVEMSSGAAPRSVADVKLPVLVAAFVTSELRTAFQIGFVLFLPFVIIDIVVAAVLMSMGMVMLPPAMISLPFKLLLFVLVDGWTLVVQSLVASFH